MDQPGVEIRPIRQMTGTSEFNEVFFDRAHTDADLVVGEVNDGWRVALATLAFERGVGLLGDIVGFRKELDQLIELARKNGRTTNKVMRQRLAEVWIRLFILRLNTLRSLTGVDGPVAPPQASISKLFWATWHRDLGELAMDVLGMHAEVAEFLPYELSDLQRIFLFSRADTIYGGSNEIQRNIIGERVLGLPPEPKVAATSEGSPHPRDPRRTTSSERRPPARPRPSRPARGQGGGRHRRGRHGHRLLGRQALRRRGRRGGDLRRPRAPPGRSGRRAWPR